MISIILENTAGMQRAESDDVLFAEHDSVPSLYIVRLSGRCPEKVCEI